MNTKNFIQLHREARGLQESGSLLNQKLAKLYKNEKEKADYLTWLTATARDDSQGKAVQDEFALQIKAVQRNINLSNTQQYMINGKLTKDSLVKKVRLMRANKPLLASGHVSQKDIDNKQYFFITTDILPPADKPLTERLANFMTRHNVNKKAMLDALKEVEVSF